MTRPPDLDENGRPASGTRPPDLTDTGEPISASSSVSTVSQSEPDTFLGGAWRSIKQQLGEATNFSRPGDVLPTVHAASPRVEQFMSTPLANPTGIDAVDSFLSPAGLASLAAAGAVGTAKKLPVSGTLRLGANVLEASPHLQKWIPFADSAASGARALAQVAKDAQMGVVRGAEQYQMARTPSIVDRAPRAAQMIGEPGTLSAPASPPDLSRPVPAGSLSQADIRARIDAVRAQGGLPPQELAPSTRPTVGQLRLATGQGGPSGPGAIPPPAPPAAIQEPAANWNTTVPEQVGSALDPARVDIGAEQAGRATGMTKQQVRDVATPILDAAPGEASPILPEKALKRIIDTIKELPKGGPEREAYVQKATSGKTQWQVENIRRTLEHLGLIVPVAAGAGLGLRETIRRRLSGSE